MVKPSSEEGQGPQKERETKDDGRYIIFYTFAGEEAGEDGPSDDKGGEAS